MAAAIRHGKVGELLQGWRQRRRLSQLDLAGAAGVSARHLSFVETGRSRPSPELVLHLAEHLEVPLRERNTLLLAAGYAPAYAQTDLDAPELTTIRGALRQVLVSHEPFPALVVDRHWNVVDMNAGVGLLIAGVDAALLAPPVNALRLSLSPDGLAPRIANLVEWSGHLLTRLRREVLLTGDAELSALFDELASYPGVADRHEGIAAEAPPALAVPLRLRLAPGSETGELVFVSTVTTFGTALDVTLAELSLEAFLPANPETVAALHALTPSALP